MLRLTTTKLMLNNISLDVGIDFIKLGNLAILINRVNFAVDAASLVI